MAQYLKRHQIVYLSPPMEGWEGIPLGNGTLGGMLWASTEGWMFQVNHTDTYDMPDPATPDEGWYSLRSCGRLTVQHSVPVHDWLYLNDFEARLSLHDAVTTWQTRGAFGEVSTSSYVHARRPVVVFRHRASYGGELSASGAPIRIRLERWGSRIFGWWYSYITGGASQGLSKVRAWADGSDICLDVFFGGVSVSIRCRVLGVPSEARVLHSHATEIEVSAARNLEFTILVACVTSLDASDPAAAAKAALDAAAGEPALYEEHRRWWAEFWQRSFVHIAQDYYENLYYVHHYLMGSSSRGRFPPLFNGGLWIWNRDVRNWANPHHWNQQQSFWCVPAAGRWDLLQPYLDTYFRLMPHWRAAAERRGLPGIWLCEMHDFLGRPLGEHGPSFKDNFTPAAQVALFFWWHYCYSGDERLLREKGYPFLKAVGDFYLALLRWDPERQQYEIPPASTYEDERPLRFTNSITNLAMIRAIFPALLRSSEALGIDAEMRSRWQHVLDHLPPYLLNDRDKSRGVTLASGLLDGKDLPEKENHNHGPLFCPVFPAGDLGLKDRGSATFEAACRTLATYFPFSVAITPTVVVAARLGMAEEARLRLCTMVRNLQHFPNGLFFNIDHWHIYSRRWTEPGLNLVDAPHMPAGACAPNNSAPFQRDYLEDRGCRFPKVLVRGAPGDGVDEHRANTPTAPFSQMGMESLGNFAAGIQEMLLQSHEGVIRVFPAVPDDWEAAFILYAEGGFRVASRRAAHSEPVFVEVISQRGLPCSVWIPWRRGCFVWSDGKAVPFDSRDGCACFSTYAGERYVLGPAGSPLPNTELAFAAEVNRAPKRFMEATVGKERDF